MANPDDLQPVDLSGGATTLANQGRATNAYGRAVKQAFTTPAGNAQGHTLLEKYRQWEATRAQELNRADAITAVKASIVEVQKQLEVLKGARPTATDIEAARRKSAKRAAKKLRKARKAMALATPQAVEARAIHIAAKAMRSRRAEGGDAIDVEARGFAEYLKAGGGKATTLATFGRLIARG